MRKAQFFYLLRRGLLSGGLNLIKEGLVMASKFTTQGLSFPAQGSAEFNGSSYITIGNKSFVEKDAFSVSFWMYPNTTIEKYIFSTGYNNASSLLLLTSAGNIYALYRNASNSNTLSSGTSFNADEWSFVSYTYDGTTLKIYINGSERVSQSLTIGSLDEGLYEIGEATPRANTNTKYEGNLANVAIWNRALSSDEINSVMWKSYEALSGTESNGLQAWYSLDDITSPAASLATMQQLATDKNATIENTAAITAAINSLS